jgi:hypothetical protein
VAVVIKRELRIEVGGTIVHGIGFVNSMGAAPRPENGRLEKHNDIPDTSGKSVPLRN